MTTKKWFLIAIVAFGIVIGVAQLFVHPTATRILGLTGFVCLFIGLRYYKPREALRRLDQTIPQVYRDRLAGIPLPWVSWEQGLQWLGVGLLVLSFWRQWSGLP